MCDDQYAHGKPSSGMGICKAFGADRGRLLRQILIENLILTCLGGCWAYVGSGRY